MQFELEDWPDELSSIIQSITILYEILTSGKQVKKYLKQHLACIRILKDSLESKWISKILLGIAMIPSYHPSNNPNDLLGYMLGL